MHRNIFTVMDKQLIILTCHVCCSDFLLLQYLGPVKQEETGGLRHLFLIYKYFFFPCACHWRGGNRSYWAINRKDTLCGKRAFNRGCYMSYKRRHVLPGDLMCEPSTDFNAADEILTTEALSGATRKWTDWHTRTRTHTQRHTRLLHPHAGCTPPPGMSCI